MPIILHVVGARPNFMKAAPVYLALQGRPGLEQRLVHTGQHYDRRMSDVFFEELELPLPDHNLGVGSGSHAVQTAEVMVKFEQVMLAEKPAAVVVYGDVNSTLAAALVAAKLGVRVAHVEAGLRSGDWTMPEEINRVVTDRLSDWFFTPSADGDQNLRAEGVLEERIFMVGNCMIDSLVRMLGRARRPALPGLPERYALVTLHRPSNVDDAAMLARVMAAIAVVAETLPVVFPVHPRTRQRLAEIRWPVGEEGARIHFCDPLGYTEFLWLQQHATVVVTDSGGVQEETTYLRVPCLTLRENTERPVTCTLGTNKLLGQNPESLGREIAQIVRGNGVGGSVPPLWDGRAGERIAQVLASRVQ